MVLHVFKVHVGLEIRFRRSCSERIDGAFAEGGVESGNQVIAALSTSACKSSRTKPPKACPGYYANVSIWVFMPDLISSGRAVLQFLTFNVPFSPLL